VRGAWLLALEDVLYDVVLVAVIASMPSVIWFFYFRRVMIRKQSALAALLERLLRPRDKLYMYLGYLVGFRAEYRVSDERVKSVEATYTTPPYHVFFYLPLIALFGKREKLDLVARLREAARSPRGEAHVYDDSVPSVRLAVKGDLVGEYKEAVVESGGRRYKALYRGEAALDEAKRILSRLASRGVRVYRVSVDGSRRAVMVSVEPTGPEAVEAALHELFRASGSRLRR